MLNASTHASTRRSSTRACGHACTYLDMAMTLSAPHPTRPYEETGVKLGDYQFEQDASWGQKGLLALSGSGVEPGAADVFARYAADELFDEIDEIGDPRRGQPRGARATTSPPTSRSGRRSRSASTRP